MLQLLNPIALLTITAVAIPVLVHLWNVRKGKTLRVGSIALLATSSRQRARNLRITNWPLFLLRCLLFILLNLLLAGPVWHKPQQATGQPGWILIPQQQLRAAYAQYQPQIDSLLAAGLELHNFSTGFEKIQLQDSIQPMGIVDGCLPGNDDERMMSRWSLLKVLDANLPKGFPLHVFINNRLSGYHGSRPVTHLSLHWNSFSTNDSIERSPALSYVTDDGKIKNIEWVSTPQGNYYSENNTGATFTAAVDTSIIRVSIYPGKNMSDAQYVKAAIQAIGQFTNRKINIALLSAGQSPSAEQNLIFCLDEQPGTELLSYVTPKGILFQYDTGTVVQTASWLQEGTQTSGEGIHNKLYRYTNGPVQGTPVWTLANGTPLLTVTEKEGKQVYHYKGRFNPIWGDMVWEDDFVKVLLPLVVLMPASNKQADLRSMDDRQAKPQQSQNIEYRIQHSEDSNQITGDFIQHDTKDLSTIVWIAVFLVFAAERVLTHWQQRKQHA